jgi:hypothetical protein
MKERAKEREIRFFKGLLYGYLILLSVLVVLYFLDQISLLSSCIMAVANALGIYVSVVNLRTLQKGD